MSSLFGSNLRGREKAEEKRGREMVSMRHEQVYHAAVSSQAASLSLTALSLRGQFWVCQIESQKNAGFLARVEPDQCNRELLSCLRSMQTLCLLKDGSLIGFAMVPHGKDDPDAHIGKSSYRHGVTFALSSFALVIGQSPWFTQCGLPGKLLQGIAQGFDAPEATVGFAVHPTLKLDW